MVVGLQWDWAQVRDRPKIVLDLEEPEIGIGPRKLFSDWIRTGPTGQNCKELQLRPKRSFGPRRLKEMRIGPEFQLGPDLGFWNHRSPILIKNTSVEKLEIPRTSGPIFFLCLWCYEITCTCISHVIHKCPQYNAVACISHHRNMLGNKCYFLIGNQIINRIMWLV